MKNLLNKELKLATSPLAWLFLLFSLMTFIPGYPILLGSFFVCLGLFHSFQNAGEANDILYTALLPVRKADAVKAKYVSVCFFELVAFLLMVIFTVVRMTVMSDSPVYGSNVMMNATPLYLAFALIIFALFNLIFLGGFFMTAYKIGKPFIVFIVVTMIIIAVGESIHHIPGLEFFNVPSGERMGIQLAVLAAGAVVYAVVTFLSEKRSEHNFERIDL